jgi:hypothetical protein
MVPSSVLVIAADGERLSCGGFSLDETIGFGSLVFIADYFGGLSLSSLGDVLGAIVMDYAYGRPQSPPRTMMRDSAEEFPIASNGEGRIGFLSPKRHGMGAPPASAMTIPLPENPPTTQTTATILPRQATPQSDTNLLLERRRACQEAAL